MKKLSSLSVGLGPCFEQNEGVWEAGSRQRGCVRGCQEKITHPLRKPSVLVMALARPLHVKGTALTASMSSAVQGELCHLGNLGLPNS